MAMLLRRKLAPGKQNTKEYREQMIKAIIQSKAQNQGHLARDQKAYNIFNLEDKWDHDYLQKYGDYVMPAKVRRIPIIKPKLQRYLSMETRRPIDVRVIAVDQESVKKKLERRKADEISALRSQVVAKVAERQIQIAQLQQKQQEVQQLASQKQTKENQQQLQQIKQQLPQLETVMNLSLDQLGKENLLPQEKLVEIDKHYKYSYQDEWEMSFEKGLSAAVEDLRIDEQKKDALKDRFITGKSMFYVDWEPGMPNPEFRRINSLYVTWPRGTKIERIQDSRWVFMDERATLNEILDEFGAELNSEQIRELVEVGEAHGYTYDETFMPTPSDGAIDTGNAYGSFRSKGSSEETFSVQRVFYKDLREVLIKVSPNPYNDEKPFRKLIESPQEVRDYRGEKLERRYIEDLYKGTVIAGRIVTKVKKCPVQIRDPYDPWKVQLPILGRTHNGETNKEYSLVWATKEIEELVSIINYHKELMLAIAGARGFVMDISQKPEGMNREEWMYEFKRGVAWIQSLTKQGKVRTQYNQFQRYDNTINESIVYLDRMIDGLDNMANNIIGVAREAQGQTEKSDQVGTYKMATAASNLIMEIVYYEHDQILEEALERFINLAKYAWKDGKQHSYMKKDISHHIINIKGNIPDEVFFKTKLKNKPNDITMMDELRNQARIAHAKGEITFSQLLKTYDMESIKQLQLALDEFSMEVAQMAEDSNLRQEQAKSKLKQAEIELEAKYDMAAKQQDNQFKEMQLKIELMNLQMQKQKMDAELALRGRELDDDRAGKMADIKTERDVEAAYLQEQQRASMMDEQIRKLQLKLDALVAGADIALGEKEVDVKKEAAKKTTAASNGAGKEHIKDN